MRPSLAVLGAVALAVAAGCGSSSRKSDAGSGTTGGPRKVPVQITDKGCAPPTLELPAGPTTFEVTNEGGGSITEYEVVRDNRIIGEAENVAPGLNGSFTITLKPGEYETKCPPGKSGKLTVLG